MCDLISSTTYNHKKNHTSGHIYHFPGVDPQAELQHQPSTEPLPRVRTRGLEAVEEGQQPNATLGRGLRTHHVLCTSRSLGFSPILVLNLTWEFCPVNTLPCGKLQRPRWRLVSGMCSPSAHPTSHSGPKVLALWSPTQARFPRKSFVLPEILLP